MELKYGVAKCDVKGCRKDRTHVSRCTSWSCPDGRAYKKACDDHTYLLCAPEMVW